MPRKRVKTHLIEKPDQLRALAHPVRLQIIKALETNGPSSAGDLADHLGKPAASLYYHIHALTDAGLIVKHSLRKGTRRDEQLYAPVARAIHVDPGGKPRAYLEALADLAATSMRHAEREHRRALLDGDVRVSGPLRQRAAYTLHIHMDDRQLREFNRRILEFIEWAYANETPDGPGYEMTMLMSPSA